MANTLIFLAESSGGSEGVHPWVIGGSILVVLLILLLAVVTIGGGREHS